jgi:hypothetical protein
VRTRDATPPGYGAKDTALIDLLDRLLAGGVVLTGDITLAAADIDLVQVDLRALIPSVPVGGAR